MSTDIYCTSCTEVSHRLNEIFSVRRQGIQFVVDEDEMSYIASFGTVKDIFERSNCPSCIALQQEIKRWENVYGWERQDDEVLRIKMTESNVDVGGDMPQPYYLQSVNPDTSERTIIMNLYVQDWTSPLDERGRTFDANHIDLDIVRGWLRCCDETHGDACLHSLVNRLSPDAMPPRLLFVDVERECLIYGSLDVRYIALSYVWGQVDTLKTTTANIDHFLQPGSLKIVSDDYHLPATIQDVMRLAVQLGVRYVWVDTLCIIQDGGDKQTYLRGMAAIYASAYLTVTSNGFDADFGLIGIGPESKPRNRKCRKLPLPNMSSPLIMDDNRILPNQPATWAKRAWTFQEGIFSRRMLTFDLEGLVSWNCRRHFWNEEREAPSEALDWAEHHPEESAPDWRYLGVAELNFEWPDMRRWCELMEEYYERELTFDSDAFSALAGLVSVVNHTSPAGLFYGLPEYFFDIFLLWDLTPAPRYTEAEPGGVAINLPSRRTSPLVPSWSFLGWKHGVLDLQWCRMSMDHTFIDDPQNGFGSDVAVGSIVTWSKQDKETDELTAIANLYQRDRKFVEQGILPPGWQKESDEGGDEYFRHESLGDIHFRYPVTLPSSQSVAVGHDHWSQRLHFQTQRAWLRLGKIIKPTAEGGTPSDMAKHVSLIDDEGRWAGAIRLTSVQVDSDGSEGEEGWEEGYSADDNGAHGDGEEAVEIDDLAKLEDELEHAVLDGDDEEDTDEGPESNHNLEQGDVEHDNEKTKLSKTVDEAEGDQELPGNEQQTSEAEARGTAVELIAVATGKVRNDSYPKKGGDHNYHQAYSIPEWNCKRRPSDGVFYEFYFVLWIEWEDGIAYRRALGRVEKGVWEATPLEDIDIVLG